MDQRMIKWKKWIFDIQKDAELILESQETFKFYIEMLKDNPDIASPSDFHWFIRDNYVSYIAMCIRRQAEWKDHDIISLAKLLKELEENPTIITREWFNGNFKYDWSDGDFTNVAGTGNHFDPNIAKEDLENLTRLSANITKFADRRIAHNSKQPVPTVVFNEVDDFLKEFERILTKYLLLFTAAGYSGLMPIKQYDWQIIFTKPWIKRIIE